MHTKERENNTYVQAQSRIGRRQGETLYSDESDRERHPGSCGCSTRTMNGSGLGQDVMSPLVEMIKLTSATYITDPNAFKLTSITVEFTCATNTKAGTHTAIYTIWLFVYRRDYMSRSTDYFHPVNCPRSQSSLRVSIRSVRRTLDYYTMTVSNILWHGIPIL